MSCTLEDRVYAGAGRAAAEERKIAKRLKALRSEASMTLEEAAERSGVSACNLKKYEAGAAALPAAEVRPICTAYGVGEEELFFDVTEEHHSKRRHGQKGS